MCVCVRGSRSVRGGIVVYVCVRERERGRCEVVWWCSRVCVRCEVGVRWYGGVCVCMCVCVRCEVGARWCGGVCVCVFEV